MTSDESPRESEPTGNIEQDKSEPQATPKPAGSPTTKAEIILRKHHICPYLGLRDDRTVVAMLPTSAHACFARRKRYQPSVEHQMVRCLSSNYPGCSIYPDKPAEAKTRDSLYTLQGDFSRNGRGWGWLRWGGLGLLALLLVGGGAYAATSGLVPLPRLSFLSLPAGTVQEVVAPAVVGPTVMVTSTETPTESSAATSALAPAVVAQAPSPVATDTPIPTPTGPLVEGEVLSLTPSRADVGWWASAQTQPGQLGDSFLYSGVFDQQAYMSIVRFDLRRVPRGARIEEGRVRLTGLRDDLLDRSTNSSWMVQLISEGALPDVAGATFFTLYEAPVSFDLVPNVESGDVGPGVVNEWTLDSATRGWLFQQLLDGATSVVLRIVPLENAGNALFAWDSGHGSESSGATPELILSLGPTPPTPPPTPTRPQVVATLTPTPENVMTVVALTPPAPAQAPPTNTPVPPEIVTPTPVAMDLPAVQTAAVAEGRPAVLLDTPFPANTATATTIAAYATAVALTTGTFTPVPTNYVTPVLYYPPPPAENVATAAARSAAATVSAQLGTPTPPRHPNAVDAIYVYATETPANQETAIAMIADQNRMAVTTGTPTPTPWNLVVITRVPEPTATPIPLFIPTSQITPSPTPTPTRILTLEDWERFRGKILFLSDRGGEEQTWVLDPVTGDVTGMVTDERIHSEARAQFLPFSPDEKERAIVQTDGRFFIGTDTPVLQIKIENFEYNTIRQLTNVAQATAYDPAWSPRGDQMAFVGTMSNGDEIYTIPLSGGDPLRLTFNTWEWDKHPTWSPDGTQIAFFSNRETGRRQIWVMNADGSNQRNLSNSEYEDWDPVWVR
jgi:hypothetical protein